MSEILLAGASGLIGSKLINKLKQKNYKIVLLSTQKRKQLSSEIEFWDPENGQFPDLDLSKISACFNFCGAGIFDENFTEKRKTVLRNSRITPIKFLQTQFRLQGVKLPHFISSSGTGFYPNICLNKLYENSTPGQGFIAELVQDWEKAANTFSEQCEKVSIVRTGIVLAAEGGFLKKLSEPIKYFAGAIPGSGKQMLSWIHIDDMSNLLLHLFEKGISGTFNAVAPEPERLENITRFTAKCLKRPILLPNIPEFMLRLIFGKERSDLLMCSQIISSEKIIQSGFQFQFNNSEQALNHLLGTWKK